MGKVSIIKERGPSIHIRNKANYLAHVRLSSLLAAKDVSQESRLHLSDKNSILMR